MGHILRVFGTLALLGMLAVSMGPASAAQLQLNAGAPYLCAVVQGGSTAWGTPVIAYSCSGGPEDQWEYVNGQIQGIGTANGVSMCLDVYGAGTTPGTPVDLWPCNGEPSQQWEILNSLVASGPEILGLQSNMCVDSSGGPAVGGGTQLVINPCTGTTSQSWIVRGMQLEFNASAPYVCANVEGGKTANGTPVLAYSCDDAPNELWNYENGQILGIGTENGTARCLSVVRTGGSYPIPVTLSTCTSGNVYQDWVIVNCTYEIGDCPGGPATTYEIKNVPIRGCLDTSGGASVGGGTQLVLNACTGAASQNWNVR